MFKKAIYLCVPIKRVGERHFASSRYKIGQGFFLKKKTDRGVGYVW